MTDLYSHVLAVNAGPRLDRLPFGKFHWKVLCIVGAGVFLEGFDLYLQGGVLAALLKNGWSTLALNAKFISATFLGLMVGAILSGIFSDAYGRRFCFRMNLLIFGLGSLAAAFAPTMDVLIALRFIIGVGLGAEAVVGYSFISEMMPVASRGRWVASVIVAGNFSLFIASLLGLWLIPHFGWQSMFLVVGIGAVIIWFLRKSLPESPRWLEAKGRFQEAEAVLRTIESQFTDLPLPKASHAQEEKSKSSTSIFALFSRDVVMRTTLAVIGNIVLGFSLYGLVGWLPSFFIKQGVSIVNSLYFTTVMSLGGPFGCFLTFLMGDRIGRRPIIVVGSIVTAMIALIYPFMHQPGAVMVVGFCLVTVIYAWVATVLITVPELFPTRYRLRGAGFSSMAGRLATALVQFAVVPIFNWGGVQAIVGGLAVILLGQAAAFFFFAPETCQKPLDSNVGLPKQNVTVTEGANME